jgi:hypothetical protein
VVPLLFADVQKLLQVGRFFLFSHRPCSPLFVRVCISAGVNGASFDVDLYPYPPPLQSHAKAATPFLVLYDLS